MPPVVQGVGHLERSGAKSAAGGPGNGTPGVFRSRKCRWWSREWDTWSVQEPKVVPVVQRVGHLECSGAEGGAGGPGDGTPGALRTKNGADGPGNGTPGAHWGRRWCRWSNGWDTWSVQEPKVLPVVQWMGHLGRSRAENVACGPEGGTPGALRSRKLCRWSKGWDTCSNS